jgi:hypothetical protein
VGVGNGRGVITGGVGVHIGGRVLKGGVGVVRGCAVVRGGGVFTGASDPSETPSVTIFIV